MKKLIKHLFIGMQSRPVMLLLSIITLFFSYVVLKDMYTFLFLSNYSSYTPAQVEDMEMIVDGYAGFLVACQEEDKTTTLDKEGSISVVVSTKHLNDSFDVMSVTTETFKKNKSVSVKVTYDTIPTLGKFKTEAEDSLGNVKEVTIPKEYEFYVTLK